MVLRGVRYSAFVAVICVAIYAICLPMAAQNQEDTSSKPAAAPSLPICITGGISPCAELSGKPASAPSVPVWAYPYGRYTPQSARPKVEDENTPKRVPGSTVTYTLKQIGYGFDTLDWHPDDHPPMPEIVSHGRKAFNVKPCGHCHLATGQGRLSNGPIGGLTTAYLIHQVRDFQQGLRTSSDMRRLPVHDMIATVKNMTDEDLNNAAEYFAGMKFKPWIRVVEGNTIPKAEYREGTFVTLETGEKEPLGERIIEVPENIDGAEWRDTHSGFVAYVPEGSIKKGEELATTGGGKTMKCEMCHGQNLRGMGNVPPIAGRSATYIVRQLNDFQDGARHGEFSPMMKGVVEKLSLGDMLALAAYVSSLAP